MNLEELRKSIKEATGLIASDLDWPDPDHAKCRSTARYGDHIRIVWKEDDPEFKPLVDDGYIFGLPEFASDDADMAGMVHIPHPAGDTKGGTEQPEWTTLWDLEHNPRVERIEVVGK